MVIAFTTAGHLYPIKQRTYKTMSLRCLFCITFMHHYHMFMGFSMDLFFVTFCRYCDNILLSLYRRTNFSKIYYSLYTNYKCTISLPVHRINFTTKVLFEYPLCSTTLKCILACQFYDQNSLKKIDLGLE